MSTRAETAARNAEMSAYIAAHPELTYTDIGQRFGVSASAVARVAVQHDIQRPRGYNGYHYGKAQRQVKRDQGIIAYHADNPKASYAAIAIRFHTSQSTVARVLNGEKTRRQAEQDRRIVAYLRANPDFTYSGVAKELGVSANAVRRTADRLGLQSRYSHVRKRAPKCFKCTILTEKIDEGVAIVQVGKARKRACQDCVERFDLEVVRWEREPVEMEPAETIHRAADITTARWPILEVV